MKKLFFLSLLLLSYLIGLAQDTIPNPRNTPTRITNPDQLSVPKQPTSPSQLTIPNQQSTPNTQNSPNQQNVPVQPTAPQQANPVQPSGTYQPAQSTVPGTEQQNKPKVSQPNIQSSGYQPMSDIPRIGNKMVRFAFIASPQVTWLTSGSKLTKSNKNRLGFAYGIEGDVFLASDRYSLLTGFVISSVGGTLEYETPFRFNGSADQLPAKTKVDYFLRYIEIPLAIKLRSKDFNSMRFFAQFGLNTWMNIKAKGSTSDGSFDKDMINDEVRFFALGLNVGAGVEYDLGDKNSITGGIIYSGSFNDVTSNSDISDKTTINSLRIRLGFIF